MHERHHCARSYERLTRKREEKRNKSKKEREKKRGRRGKNRARVIFGRRARLSLSPARSSERNRVTRSTPTYFRQTCGQYRDVRTVCSCQPSDFSKRSPGNKSSAWRSANERRGALDFTFIARPAKRFAYAHSLSFACTRVRAYARARTCTRASSRVRACRRACFISSFLSRPRYRA